MLESVFLDIILFDQPTEHWELAEIGKVGLKCK